MPASTSLPSTKTPSPRSRAQSSPAPGPVPVIAVPPAEAARLLSCSLSRAYELMRNGELESYSDGRSRRVTMASIHKHVARRVADAADNGGWRAWEHNPQARRSRQVKERA